MTSGEYIRELFEPTDRIAIVLISRAQDLTIQRTVPVEVAATDKYQAWLRHMNSKPEHGREGYPGRPCDVYVSMNPLHPDARHRTKEDVREARRVFLDIDSGGKEALQRIAEAPDIPKPSYILESSPGRFQSIWNIQGFSKDQAETWARNMTREFGADPARVDVSSVMRLPGFVNQKYPEQQHWVAVREVDRGRVVTPADFPDRLFENSRSIEHVSSHERGGERRNGVDQNREDFKYAMRHLRAGRDAIAIAHEIDEYRKTHGGKVKGRGYGQRTVEKAQQWLERDRYRQIDRIA